MDASERKAAVAAWRERKAEAGIYAIRCIPTGALWVGRAPDLATIWTRQSFVLRLGSHMRPALQAAWNAHGADSFAFEVIEKLEETASDAGRDAFLKTRLAAWRDKLGAELA
jgi:hypothetical protein